MSEIHDFHPDRILCPIDFNPVSDLALRYAAAAARVHQSRLTVHHAARVELPPCFTGDATPPVTSRALAAPSR
jgi:hypothetical protein